MVSVLGFLLRVGDHIVRAKAIRGEDPSLVFDLSGEVSLIKDKPLQ